MNKPRLLWVGDAGCPSGFARATHETLDTVKEDFDVTVLGINYRGDPHHYPYPLYAAAAGGDQMGVYRLPWMCDLVKPDVVVLQNDPWNIPQYINSLKRAPEYKDVPVVGVIAVDGKNCSGAELDPLALAIFWTEFGRCEAQRGGYKGPSAVIPIGVDLGMYFPGDKRDARERMGLGTIADAFIVGNVNRNQPRKRFDLMIRYFAEWVHGGTPVGERSMETLKVKDAYLFLHVAPTGDTGCDIKHLAHYYGVLGRLAANEPEMWYGINEHAMRDTYNLMDVCATTSQGEGFGLTSLEAMACGVPVVAGDWSALGDWAKGAAWLVPCTSTHIGPPYVNVIGGVPDEALYVRALRMLYNNREALTQNGKAALERASEARFRWSNIGRKVSDALLEVVKKHPVVRA